MTDTAFDPGVIAADAVVLAEPDGGTGREHARIDCLLRRLQEAPAEDMHAPTEWIRADSIAAGARQRRPRAARN